MSARPWRLYEPKTKKNLRWRCYTHKRNAIYAAMCEAYESPIGRVIQLINVDEGDDDYGTYKRIVKHVRITGEK